jgi:hypothetical protein
MPFRQSIASGTGRPATDRDGGGAFKARREKLNARYQKAPVATAERAAPDGRHLV